MTKQPVNNISSLNYIDALFENTVQNNVLLMNGKGIIVAVNKAFTHNFGYQPEDIIGKPASVLFTEEDQKKGLPEKEIHTVLTTGQGFDNNYLVPKDQSITWVSGESVLIKNDKGEKCILKIIQNIQQQKVSEGELQNLNEFNESILSNIEDVVIVIDSDMNIIKTNRAFYSLFDLKDKDISANFASLVKENDSFDMLLNNIDVAFKRQKNFTNTMIEIKTVEGEKRMYDVSGTSMQHGGNSSKILLVMHDITVHKQGEREREDVIGFVAHELRNPLANLVLCNDIMTHSLEEKKFDDIADMLQRSKNNVFRLNKMIAELYEATRVNSGNFKLDFSTFNFEKMIKEAIDTVKVLQPSYNIIIKGEGNIDVSADRYRMIQVVTNYLSNSIKYSNGNTDVVLTIYHDNKSISVSVKDEGLGIPKNQLPFIFERFFRAEKTKNLEGIGLGLYLCRQIIHAHHGNVWAESEEGKGSIFNFSIPLL